MNLLALLKSLQELAEQLPEGVNPEVRFATQPAYPFLHSIVAVAQPRDLPTFKEEHRYEYDYEGCAQCHKLDVPTVQPSEGCPPVCLFCLVKANDPRAQDELKVYLKSYTVVLIEGSKQERTLTEWWNL